MPVFGITHTLNEGPWHYCGVCGNKTKLESELQWQNNVLKCDWCRDSSPIQIGAIEAARARYLATIISNPDLRPSEKLTNPEVPSDIDDDIFI